MNDPHVKRFSQANALKTPLFPPTSRYYGIGSAALQTAEGTDGGLSQAPLLAAAGRSCAGRKSIASAPATGSIIWPTILRRRRSSIGGCATPTARCDPAELTETVGRRLRITLPEGVPGQVDG